MTKLLSIITVINNDLKRFKQTVSTLSDFYNDNNFEHIIIDSFSHDGTQNFSKELKKSYKNLFFYSEKDTGIYNAMNKGILKSNGDFILFLNAGDQIIIQKNILLEKLKKLKSENNYDVICFPYEINLNQRYIVRSPFNSPDKLPCSHQSMIFSKDFLKKNKYNINYKIAADFDLFRKTNLEKVKFILNYPAVSRVEEIGVASKRFFTSYYEYIQILIRNDKNIYTLYFIIKLIFKMSLIAIINMLFSQKYISSIRFLYYKIFG